MNLVKVHVLSAPHIVLDWAVAKLEGIDVVAWKVHGRDSYFVVLADEFKDKNPDAIYPMEATFYPSSDFAKGGEIVQREQISLVNKDFPFIKTEFAWCAVKSANKEFWGYGDDILQAAMRCFIISRMGEFIDVPEDLL